MEPSLFAHLSPVGSFNAHYFGISETSKGSPIHYSDNSMDTEFHNILKCKQRDEDGFFNWSGDIRPSLGEEKEDNSISHHEVSKNTSNAKLSQNPGQFVSKKSNILEKGQSEVYVKDQYRKSDIQDQNLISREAVVFNNVQSKDLLNKEGTHMDKQFLKVNEKAMGKGGNAIRDDSGNGVRADIDLLLEKSHMSGAGDQGETGASGVIRKRKMDASTTWPGGKISRVVGSTNHREVISTSRMSSEWQDLDVDLHNELSSSSYNMSDALLTMPVYKEEAPSPTAVNTSSPPWMNRQTNVMNSMTMVNVGSNCNGEQQNNVGHMQSRHQQQGINHGNSPQVTQMMVQQGQQQMSNYQAGVMQAASSQNNEQNLMDVTSGLLMCNSLENFSSCMKPAIQALPDSAGSCDNRLMCSFQYVLAAATSIATKNNEDTLTYLNQCQSYEIKLKKLGELTHFRGKILKSIIRICFHERRLQYAEREQMAQWQSERPGERIVEVDVPLSYGLINVFQPTEQPLLNTVEIFWDPMKEAGVYIKVNCISTEFTAKKHGGEKGVPFRIQVETFLSGDSPTGLNNSRTPEKRLHAAACQIKVFKLKGADRKHKQDREKILRRPDSERDKYQPSYECTVFTDIPLDSVFSPVMSSTQVYSPESGVHPSRPPAPPSASPPRIEAPLQQLALTSPHNDMKVTSLSRVNSHGSSLDCDDDNICKPLIQGNVVSTADDFELRPLTERSTATETRIWLTKNRFSSLIATFTNFSGADLLRLSRDDLIQLCNLADGIRLYNAMHSEHTPARVTLYVKKVGEKTFSAIYLRSYQVTELKKKLLLIYQDGNPMYSDMTSVYVSGPNGIKVNLTDEWIRNIRNDSMFSVDTIEDGIILKPAM